MCAPVILGRLLFAAPHKRWMGPVVDVRLDVHVLVHVNVNVHEREAAVVQAIVSSSAFVNERRPE